MIELDSTRVTVSINSGNAALVGDGAGEEVIRILRKVADHIIPGAFGAGETNRERVTMQYRLSDINGNEAGFVRVSYSPQGGKA